MEGKDYIDKDDVLEIQNCAKKLVGTHMIISNRDGSYLLFSTKHSRVKAVLLNHIQELIKE